MTGPIESTGGEDAASRLSLYVSNGLLLDWECDYAAIQSLLGASLSSHLKDTNTRPPNTPYSHLKKYPQRP